MNYSDNEIKIRALKFFQSRIVSYLQIIINKEYYFISRSMNFYYWENNKIDFPDSLFDGEMVGNEYYLFDCLFYNNINNLEFIIIPFSKLFYKSTPSTMSAIVETEPESNLKLSGKQQEERPPSTKTTDWANRIISGVTLRPLEETDATFKFTLAGLNVSLANALRRTIQDDIPAYVFDIKTCKIDVNTGRLHNEILKHRLECIPVHSKVDVDDWLMKRPEHNIFEKLSTKRVKVIFFLFL